MNWFDYLTSASSYSGADGITQRLVQHLEYSGSALFFTVLIGLPLGLILDICTAAELSSSESPISAALYPHSALS